MDGMVVPMLFAGSAGLASWSVSRLVLDGGLRDRRKLKERLSNQQRVQSRSTEQKSIRTDLSPEGIEGVLHRFSIFRDVDDLLQLSYPDLGLVKFLGIVAGAGMAGMMIMLAVTMHPIVAIVAGVLAGTVPLFFAIKRKGKRQRMLDDQLPDSMDFLSRALRAGHSLSTGLQMMGSELPQPIAGEFAHAFGQHSLGVPMEKVMKDMTRRVDSSDFAFFVTAVLIQRQTGGDLSVVLTNISGMIRQRIRLQQQVKSKTAEGRFTGYILVAFPAVMFVATYVLNKDYAGTLLSTPLGLQMLGFAFVMQVLGIVSIRKITAVRV